ncbi:glycerol-3-phosphate 1-O-acyltransferase PlsY [Clostridium sp. D2Q-14]|uniref:glycerol-3-phosphate 1-O-acyltransferase PlsY n=1 Tax=Anaeromonas gelatinilytica TaxID=2683194 RepID=UPI00193B1EF0|nr:glycerol-3-phosphate 1-O-acyltransferase PlsY [Anaeromonas gelatinilytica]MBS4534215.1 glycerol-3-phosphate 1-O-acyltransferase PlsY [Anaeromonas gelatinilytica]
MLKILLIGLISYIVGNFSSSYILGKILKNIDIRTKGSGNAGATNALRVFGKKIGLITFILDVLKGIIAVIIGQMILGDTGRLIAGIFVVIGHNWPIILGFKGGKGIAATIGAVTFINPLPAIIAIIIGILIIIKTRYVSLGSIMAMALVPIISLVVVRPFDLRFFIFLLILAIMAIYRHKTNIRRLLNGEESKLGHKA